MNVIRIGIAVWVCAASTALAACGGATTSDLFDGASDAGGSDAKAHDAASRDAASGCISPAPARGTRCAPGQTVCVSNADSCDGPQWSCDPTTSTWSILNGICAAQTCGGTTTCSSTQYCLVEPPGIAFEDGGTPPTSYTCVDIPSACSSSPTCDCIQSPAPCDVASCHDAEGQVTLNCLGE